MAFWNRKKPDVPAPGRGWTVPSRRKTWASSWTATAGGPKSEACPYRRPRAGAETFRTIAYYCRDIGIPYLTV